MNNSPNCFVVRAGSHGEQETNALEMSVATIGFNDVGDVNKISTKQVLKKRFSELYPNKSNASIGNRAGQVWRFAKEIEKGDIIILPSKFQPVVHIGKVTGKYHYSKEGPVHHRLPVKWEAEVPRTAFDKDLLYSFGSLLTVSAVRREAAAERIWALAEGKPPPAEPNTAAGDPSDDQESDTSFDLPQFAEDEIVKLIDRTFDGHEFSDLIKNLLRAQGYTVKASPPGPDGGVDVLAGSGALGFQSPRICAQVKKTTSPVDVKIFRELRGVMHRTKAEQGLLVSWSGFTSSATKEARDDYFSIRLWSATDVLKQLYANYDKLDESIRAKIPLRRVWVLVEEEENN